MSLQKFKIFLASAKNTIPCERLQRTVFFVRVSKEQYQKTDMSKARRITASSTRNMQNIEQIVAAQ